MDCVGVCAVKRHRSEMPFMEPKDFKITQCYPACCELPDWGIEPGTIR